jgi:hypothetical protein
MDDHRVLGVGLLVIAALLVANPLYLYQSPDEVNEVRMLDEPTESVAANYSYGELSSRAQTLYDRARTAEDGRITFHGNENRPGEFEFVDEAQTVGIAGKVYRIEYEGETTYVRTFERPTVGTEANRSQGLLGLGVVLAVMCALYVRRPQPLDVGAYNAAAAAVLLLLNVDSRYTGLLGGLDFLGGWIVILLALVAAIVSLGYLLYRTMRERRLAGEL